MSGEKERWIGKGSKIAGNDAFLSGFLSQAFLDVLFTGSLAGGII